ncbi:hypothetical protein LX15_002323 [Streptoalloteichus tenebrarius]|uniref:Integral membrane protein n=1 Tax=Streptoalloteichus tenebrarius (strain ATCC 17920 / DSM 40477 / JCM 4838 / CBS 697.72 / NBRC 16177 / NCIMB 11028 / NRRL B-12390 / A12253. 1 / ISP 5477) TaxID=1933 RepID=A0ABT1HSY8_STRSD|nr:hypothetical protein [Streptoalloteichus tenebrarius]MCP2258625.1 hypothetical protein [Streptoalloteichus tenebrarius]BFF04002.1 hypothetical protein GCM10020241_56770 [Streptoalloteichus tenebrarius]
MTGQPQTDQGRRVTAGVLAVVGMTSTLVGLMLTSRATQAGQLWAHWALPVVVSLALLVAGVRLVRDPRPRPLWAVAWFGFGILLVRGAIRLVGLLTG